MWDTAVGYSQPDVEGGVCFPVGSAELGQSGQKSEPESRSEVRVRFRGAGFSADARTVPAPDVWAFSANRAHCRVDSSVAPIDGLQRCRRARHERSDPVVLYQPRQTAQLAQSDTADMAMFLARLVARYQARLRQRALRTISAYPGPLAVQVGLRIFHGSPRAHWNMQRASPTVGGQRGTEGVPCLVEVFPLAGCTHASVAQSWRAVAPRRILDSAHDEVVLEVGWPIDDVAPAWLVGCHIALDDFPPGWCAGLIHGGSLLGQIKAIGRTRCLVVLHMHRP